jgi:hypothetical protein
MILIRDLKELKGNQKPDYVVLTGDGKWEFRVLKGLSKKFDGYKILWFPELPKKFTGKSVYGATKFYVEKHDICKFLVLYDREHFKGTDNDVKTLNRLGFRSIVVKSIIDDRAFVINSKFGSKDVTVFVSIQGDFKSINEEIAELVYLKFGCKLKSDHKEIRACLKKLGVESIENLIEQSGVKYLKQAFKGLCAVLGIMENFERF